MTPDLDEQAPRLDDLDGAILESASRGSLGSLSPVHEDSGHCQWLLGQGLLMATEEGVVATLRGREVLRRRDSSGRSETR